MGAVGPELSAATFFVFAPSLVRRALLSAWEIAAPEVVQRARRTGVAEALHRVLGEPDVGEALALARVATSGLAAAGRPLYAAHSRLDWPDDPLLALWHAATLVREHRGEGHLAVLTCASLDPVESLVLGGLHDHNTDFLKTTRGWPESEWAAAEERLLVRGLLTDEKALSAAGVAFRAEVEADTDRLAVAGFGHLGREETLRLTELVAPL